MFSPRESFNGVVDRQDVNSFAVFDIGTGLDRDDVRKADTQVVANDTVHADLLAGAGFVRENDANSLLPAFSLQQDCISAEQLQFVHFGLRQTNNRIIVVCGIVDDQTIRTVLALQDRACQVISVNVAQTIRISPLNEILEIWLKFNAFRLDSYPFESAMSLRISYERI